jgi:RNA-directed DNA polymerase
MMYGQGKSDGPIVPRKLSNNPVSTGAERVEGRGPAKGNPQECTMLRTQGRERMQQALERVRQAAKQDRKMRFTVLLHHVYNPDTLREAYYGLKREAAPGVDGVTWQDYGGQLEANLQELSGRLKRGAYRARPTRRAYIDKPDGRRRPLGVMALEDKIVQRATVEVLNAIYEGDFLGFSYGFRPGRSPHKALDALYVAQLTRKVNWVLDADICGFFDAIDRNWLVKFIEHRIGDRRIVRLIQKWLNAGVLEEGQRIHSETGTVQGGSISPLLANVYLHYVFDLWVQQWRCTQARGEVIVVRYADDFIVGFQHKEEAERFMEDLRERFAKFGLELHAEKTRLIEFGPWAAENRRRRGQGRPQTFDFLGFTHICGRKRSNGRFTIYRQTMRRRLQAKLAQIKAELRRRICQPVPDVGNWLSTVLTGHYRYYGVPMNIAALGLFRYRLGKLWRRCLSRRSQKGRMLWQRMARLINRYLPAPRIYHDYPLRRFGVIT